MTFRRGDKRSIRRSIWGSGVDSISIWFDLGFDLGSERHWFDLGSRFVDLVSIWLIWCRFGRFVDLVSIWCQSTISQ